MIVAKIIRHRHKYHHYLNDDLKEVKEDTQFKIIFSDPAELEMFEKWCIENKGEYIYDKEKSLQTGTLPVLKQFKEEICWCDIMTYYLLHVAGYVFHSTISPYKGEIYVKEEKAIVAKWEGEQG